jgi:hypothetical protein
MQWIAARVLVLRAHQYVSMNGSATFFITLGGNLKEWLGLSLLYKKCH